MSTPEFIYLVPGEDIEGYPEMVWQALSLGSWITAA